ncbi:hypothetical protein BHE74_00033856 [Ensete ventricosum]|nr:hypothetical protein GW17_00052628 [Ensete ventricosum]RWW59224.1 hypothetical protein BHE74_00033856 [Ensete ventricosum]
MMQALKLLSVMAAIRLDENPDKIESALLSTLMDAPIAQERKPVTSTDPLASSTWEEVLLKFILLRNPLYLLVLFVVYLLFKALWVQLDVSSLFQNGIVSTSRTHEIYFTGQIIFLLNLKNYIGNLGAHPTTAGSSVSGFLSLSTRFLPTVMDVLRRLADEGHGQPQVPQNLQHPPLDPLSFRRDSQRQAQLSNPVPDASSSSSTLSSPRSGVECPATSHMVDADTEASSTS